MNIESKRYRVRLTGIAGQAEILDKRSGAARYVDSAELPTPHAFAMMSEAAFDRALAEAGQ